MKLGHVREERSFFIKDSSFIPHLLTLPAWLRSGRGSRQGVNITLRTYFIQALVLSDFMLFFSH